TGLTGGGIASFQQWLFVTDQQRVLRIDRQGKAEEFVPATAFPSPPGHLSDIAVDIETGTLFVSDAGHFPDKTGPIYRINSQGKVHLVSDAKKAPALKVPMPLVMDGQSHLLVVDRESGLHRVQIATGTMEKVSDFPSLKSSAGLAWDKFGRLFVSVVNE